MFGLGPEADIPFGSAQDDWIAVDETGYTDWTPVNENSVEDI